MHRLPFSLSLSLFLLAGGTLALTGCGIGSQIAASSDAAAVVSPPMQGSVYGGHAPIVGAQLYVLTPGTTGYYSASTSLMKTTTGSGGGTVYTTGQANGLTFPYVLSNSQGEFNITNDYSCTVNQPVYLVAVGGAPSYPSGSNTFAASGLTVSNVTGSGATQTATYTFTIPSTNPNVSEELFYVGEIVTLTGFTGNFAYLNNSTQTVLATGLTDTTFAATIGTYNGSSNIGAGTYTSAQGAAGTVTAAPTSNPAIINMAYLGLCPSSGTFPATEFVYMNEVSTAALAYATAGIGTGPFNIGVATTGALNTANPGYTTGTLVQAFQNATNLYDVTGSNVTTVSQQLNAGEGHIARAYTPGLNGVVPQATLNTIGNILAACVDSQNTTGNPSTQCTTLFNTAVDPGYISGTGTTTKPTDIATAAFNLAHYPAGVNNSNFISTLYGLPQANVPFLPALTTVPNDFSVGIEYYAPLSAAVCTSGPTCTSAANSVIDGPQVVAIDAGNLAGTEYGTQTGVPEAIWIGSYGPAGNGATAGGAKLFTATGIPDYTTQNNLTTSLANNNQRSVTMDLTAPASNVYIVLQAPGGALTNASITEVNNTGTTIFTTTEAAEGGMNAAAGVTVEPTTGDVFIANYDDSNTLKLTSAGANLGPNNVANTTVWESGCPSLPQVNAVDYAGNFYSLGYNGQLCELNATTGATITNQPNGTYVGQGPTFLSVDHNNTVWTVYYSPLNHAPTTNQVVGYNFGTAAKTTLTGGGLIQPCSTQVDGLGNIWAGNSGNSSVSEFVYNSSTATYVAASPVSTSGTVAANTGGYFPLNLTSNCANPAVDRAGNVWLGFNGTAATGNNAFVVELIGIAAPKATPTALATKLNELGVLPQ